MVVTRGQGVYLGPSCMFKYIIEKNRVLKLSIAQESYQSVRHGRTTEEARESVNQTPA